MKLEKLTDAEIREFAGVAIYKRGYDYFTSGKVLVCDYDEVTRCLHAEVSGNHGDYEVEIAVQGSKLVASCDCPYDGYPCKHIVAVLLNFIHRRSKFVKSQLVSSKQEMNKLNPRLAALPREELVQMILSCAEKYPDFKRELLVRFAPKQKTTLDLLLKDVAKAFPAIASRGYSTRAIAKQLKAILNSVKEMDGVSRLQVYWAVADRTLRELNEYGMQDDPLENLAADVLERLVDCFSESPQLHERKQAVLTDLMDYYLWGNSGMSDALHEAVYALCSEKSDYQILIDKMEAKGTSRAYYQSELAALYAHIGDEQAQRKALESNLQFGADHWRLAQFWIKKGDHEQALQTVQTGLAKAKGRMDELYEFLQAHYEKQNDYDRILQLLQDKIAKGHATQWGSLKNDTTYKCLTKHYAATKNYTGQKRLLELRLDANRIDLELYKDAEKHLKPEDWPLFEKELFRRLQEFQQRQRSPLGWSFGSSEAEKILAEIYLYKNDDAGLFAVAKPHQDLLLHYEARLLPQHTNFYAQHYRMEIIRLVERRGRESYKEAAKLAARVKKIYETLLHQPEEWEKFITKLRMENKALRALREELRGL